MPGSSRTVACSTGSKASMKRIHPGRATGRRSPGPSAGVRRRGDRGEHAEGDGAHALEHVREFEEATRDGPTEYRELQSPEIIRLCLARGDVELAAQVLGDRPVHVARTQHAVLTGKALLAEARGDLEAAARLFADAAERGPPTAIRSSARMPSTAWRAASRGSAASMVARMRATRPRSSSPASASRHARRRPEPMLLADLVADIRRRRVHALAPGEGRRDRRRVWDGPLRTRSRSS